MEIGISERLNARYRLISKTVEDIEQKLLLFPDGRINVKNLNGRSYYYLYANEGGEVYLGPNDTDMIRKLVQKDYLKKVSKAAAKEKTALEKMINLYPETVAEDIYDNLPEGRKKYAVPVTLCDEAYAQKWMNTPYRHKPFKKDAPEFYTAKGERVRSKSEVIIADRLAAKGIPYRYECPLKVRKKTIHPDFTILRMSDRRILYHEHCGKMDDPDYKEDMVERVNDYSAAGIILGDRLFCTFESDNTPFDVRTIDRLIDMHFK